MGAEADFLAEMRSVYVAQRAAGRRKFNTLVLTHDKTLQFFPALAQAVAEVLDADKDLDYDALTAWYDAPLKQAGELRVAILALEEVYLVHAEMQRFIATAKAELNAQTAGAFQPQLTALHNRLKEKFDFSKLQYALEQKQREMTQLTEQKARELSKLEDIVQKEKSEALRFKNERDDVQSGLGIAKADVSRLKQEITRATSEKDTIASQKRSIQNFLELEMAKVKNNQGDVDRLKRVVADIASEKSSVESRKKALVLELARVKKYEEAVVGWLMILGAIVGIVFAALFSFGWWAIVFIPSCWVIGGGIGAMLTSQANENVT